MNMLVFWKICWQDSSVLRYEKKNMALPGVKLANVKHMNWNRSLMYSRLSIKKKHKIKGQIIFNQEEIH